MEGRCAPPERAFFNQVGAHAREFALGALAQFFVEQTGNGQSQNRIAQKLQALVVIEGKAAVRQRLLQQLRLGKRMLQPLLQNGQRHLKTYLMG